MGWSIGRDYGVLPEESGPEANSAGIYHLMENTKKITKIFWPLMNASTLSGPPGAPGMTVFTSPEQDYGHTPGSLPRQVIEPSLCSNCTNQGRTQDPASLFSLKVRPLWAGFLQESLFILCMRKAQAPHCKGSERITWF